MGPIYIMIPVSGSVDPTFSDEPILGFSSSDWLYDKTAISEKGWLGGVGRPAMNINSISIIRFKSRFYCWVLGKKNVYIPQNLCPPGN